MNQCIEQIRVTKYMTFQLLAQKKKTSVWIVKNNISGYVLGHIEWYGPWRQYVFLSELGIFNNGCLDTISGFLTELNEKQKGKKNEVEVAGNKS